MKLSLHHTIINITLAVLFILKIVVLVWGLDKGFDIVDEGHHLLVYEFPELYQSIFHNYHLIITEILFFVDLNIVNLRLLGIISEILAILVFTYGFFKWLASRGWVEGNSVTFAYLFLFTSLASFLSLQDRVFAYNALTNFNILISLGLLFLAISLKNKLVIAFSAIVLAGFLVGLQLFVKFTSSLLVMFFSIIWLATNKGLFRNFIAFCLVYLLGIILSVVFFSLLTGFNIREWFSHFLEGYDLMKTWGYGTIDFYTSCYLLPLIVMLIFLVPSLLMFLASRAMIIGFTHNSTHKRNAFVMDFVPLLLSVSVFFVVYLFTKEPMYNENIYAYSDNNTYMTVYLYLLVLIELVILANDSRKNKTESITSTRAELFFSYIFLIFLPLFITFGAFTSMTDAFYGCLYPWFLLIAIKTNPQREIWLREIKAVFLIAVIFLSQVHFFSNYILHPTRLLTSLPTQNKMLDGKETIQLDDKTHRFVMEIRSVLRGGGFKQGDPIIALSNMPGIVYMAGGYSPLVPTFLSVPWAPNFEQYQIDYNCHNIGQLKNYDKRPYIILNSAISQGNIDCLKNAAIGFPANYKLIDTIFNPFKEKEIEAGLYADSVKAWTYVFKPL